jgi:hypothetical protein
MPKTTEQKLIGDGWEKKATYDDPRLSEMVAIYEEIGLEVHLEPFDAANENGCTGCMQLSPDRFKTIYTRRKSKVSEDSIYPNLDKPKPKRI